MHTQKQKAMNKIAINTSLRIFILNVNGITSAIKRHRMTEWIKKNKTICLKETHFTSKDTYRVK